MMTGPSTSPKNGRNRSAGTLESLFSELRRTGSRRVRNELAEQFLALADQRARRYGNRGESVDDLRQVALIGLIKAIDRFDPEVGAPFEAFARPTIDGEIKRHFRDRTWRITVPRRLRELRQQVAAATEVLHHELGRSPRPDEVARYLGIATETVVDALTANSVYRPASLEGARDSGREGAEFTCSATSTSTTWSAVAAFEHVQVMDAIRHLDERDRRIVYWRFFEECTQSEIGERLGVGQVQVSRLLRAALQRLREHYADDDTDLAAS